MAKIEDFGLHIPGAAKDRFAELAARLRHIPDEQVALQPLGVAFPEPDWSKLIEEGYDNRIVSYARSLRDSIPPKPHTRSSLEAWAKTVVAARRLTIDALSGNYTAEVIESHVSGPDRSDLKASIRERFYLYERMGHECSLRDVQISYSMFSVLNQTRYNPPVPGFAVKLPKTISARPLYFLDRESMQTAVIEKLAEHAERKAAMEKSAATPKFLIFSYKNKTDVHIGLKTAGIYHSLISFPSFQEARAHLRDNQDDLMRRYVALRSMPEERTADNRTRVGPEWRANRNVSPNDFDRIFHFRGVQFGNYVEPKRRQLELNNATDSLYDLADVTGVPVPDLSLGGKLGLAFGARGAGGIRAAAAHFESKQFVINLTKTRGAGSFAHEWWHAVDNLVATKAGFVGMFASELAPYHLRMGKPIDDPTVLAAVTALQDVMTAIKGLDLMRRSCRLDAGRSKSYYGTQREMSARSFEGWVKSELGRIGRQNDWLVNFKDEETYEAEAELMGAPHGRYPYPRPEELSVIAPVMERAFGPEGAVTVFLRAMRDPSLDKIQEGVPYDFLEPEPHLTPFLTSDEPNHVPAEDRHLTLERRSSKKVVQMSFDF